MRKIKDAGTNVDKYAIGIDALAEMIGVGRNSAAEIGEKANAIIRIGRRKLYNVARVQAYIDGITGGSDGSEV